MTEQLSESGRLYLRLVDIGLRHFGGGVPSAISASNWDARPIISELEWSALVEDPGDNLPERLAELAQQGPVFVVPAWERDARGPSENNTPSSYQELLQRTYPQDPEALIAMMLPESVITSDAPSAVAIRAAIAERWNIVAIIFGEGVIPSIHRAFRVATIFMCARVPGSVPLRIYRVPRRGQVSRIESDFRRVLKGNADRVDFGYVLRDGFSPTVGLDFDRNDPVVRARRKGLADFGEISPLRDLYNLRRGIPLQHAKGDGWICDEGDPLAVRVLRGKDVSRHGLIAPPGEETYWAKVPKDLELAPGDLVVRAIYGPGDPGGLVLAEVRPEDLPAVASDSLVAMRPHATLDSWHAEFAVRFMRSSLARKLIGASSMHLPLARLAELPIPRPDKDLSEALSDLSSVKERLENWADEADRLLDSVFEDDTAAATRTRIIRSGRALRQRVEAAALLDDLGHVVRTRFPYPIAARWRHAEALTSAGPSGDAYNAILDTAEILLCYAAQLALALTKDLGVELGVLRGIRDRLANGRSGPGLGDWYSVISETSSNRQLRALPRAHPLNDLRSMFSLGTADAARMRLMERRNSVAHLRRIDKVDLPVAVQEAFGELESLFESAQFLTEWPLVHVTDVRWDSLTRAARVQYRELVGDHPVVPTRWDILPTNELESGSLYVRGHERQLHLLRPFLIGQDCPVCRTWSTFHVDRASDDTIVLKSLEHGHTLEDPSLVEAIRAIGLI